MNFLSKNPITPKFRKKESKNLISKKKTAHARARVSTILHYKCYNNGYIRIPKSLSSWYFRENEKLIFIISTVCLSFQLSVYSRMSVNFLSVNYIILYDQNQFQTNGIVMETKIVFHLAAIAVSILLVLLLLLYTAARFKPTIIKFYYTFNDFAKTLRP